MTLHTIAASACVAPVASYQLVPRGVHVITIRESESKQFRVGAYVELKGRIWKVAARHASDDWFRDEVYVTLHGAHYEGIEVSRFKDLIQRLPKIAWMDERVVWLEDA